MLVKGGGKGKMDWPRWRGREPTVRREGNTKGASVIDQVLSKKGGVGPRHLAYRSRKKSVPLLS